MRNCPNCGASLEDGDVFCGACGTSIGEDRTDEHASQTDDPDRVDQATGPDQPGQATGPGSEGQPRDASQHQGGQHYQSGQNRGPQTPHQRGQPPQHHQAGQGGQQGSPGYGGPSGGIGGGAQQGLPQRQPGRGHPHQGAGQPHQGAGQPHQGAGQPYAPGQQTHTRHRPDTSGRRDALKYGLGAVVILGGGWLLYDNVLGNDLTPEEQAAADVVEANIRAYENEDIQGVRDTLHPDSPKYSQTIETSQLIFQEYDLSYDLEIESVKIEGEEARVRAVQTTRKESGPMFQDNRMEVTHVLRKHQGEWRIYDSTVNDVEYLD